MKRCNVCNKKKPLWMYKFYKGKHKLTCKQCEFSWYRTFLKFLVYRRKLTSWEKFASRIGYMGAGFLIAAQWTVEPKLYILGFICVMIQTASRKQWNLVVLNINGLTAWIKHLINGL
tara:strand:+ start:694 stop:1044 length:351 start_codon:yes stop_codon:yes gene_type:complete